MRNDFLPPSVVQNKNKLNMNKVTLILITILFVGCKKDNIEWIGQFSNGLATININGKHGYIDNHGTIKIPCKYSYATEFTEGFGRVQINGKYGFIDSTGNYLFKPNYDNVYIFENGYSTADSLGYQAIINTNGEFVSNFEKHECVYCDNDIIRIKKHDGFSFYNIKTGKQIGKLYVKANKFKNGLCAVKIENKWGFINTEGRLVVSPSYDEVGDYAEGLIKVGKDGKIGFIDSTGETRIPFDMDFVDLTDFSYGFNSFSNGLCSYTEYKNNGYKKGYIDYDGQVVIPAKYDKCYQFEKEGIAMVCINKKWGVVNSSGEEIVAPEYQYIWLGDADILKVQKNDKFGFVNLKNVALTKMIYDKASSPYLGKAVVSIDNGLDVITFD